MCFKVNKPSFFLVLLLTTLVIRLEPCLGGEGAMIDVHLTEQNLKAHVEALTETIGERSVSRLRSLEKTAEYIEEFYREINVHSQREPYLYGKETVANIVADIPFGKADSRVFLIGAHYDSLVGTVGADDNASGVAVQLEVARALASLKTTEDLDLTVRLVSFALEEPPAFATRSMGSRIYARKAKNEQERIDGMICLEMVGYTCREPGCQSYPFPLMFLGYPKTGNYIGIVGNTRSRKFTDALFQSFEKNELLPVVKLTVPWNGYLIPNVRLSDHASFWDHGYNAVMVTDTAFYRNPHYHQTSDTMDKLDFSFMTQLVRSLVLFFLSQGNSPEM
jgi:Zn-dependent M28 family amino/carboxypeptidase